MLIVQGVLDLGDIPPSADTDLALSEAEKVALAAEITTAHTALIQGMRTTVDRAVTVGQLLLTAKPHFRREWLKWLESDTPIKRRMAATYMLLAKACATSDPRKWKRIANLGVAGAVKELRLQRRKELAARRMADEQAREKTSATRSCPVHARSLATDLVTSIQDHFASYGKLAAQDLRAVLEQVYRLVEPNVWSASVSTEIFQACGHWDSVDGCSDGRSMPLNAYPARPGVPKNTQGGLAATKVATKARRLSLSATETEEPQHVVAMTQTFSGASNADGRQADPGSKAVIVRQIAARSSDS
ncbi:MAG: hypothetical protein WAS21_28300 [Geminicoccaceae bacterium]